MEVEYIGPVRLGHMPPAWTETISSRAPRSLIALSKPRTAKHLAQVHPNTGCITSTTTNLFICISPTLLTTSSPISPSTLTKPTTRSLGGRRTKESRLCRWRPGRSRNCAQPPPINFLSAPRSNSLLLQRPWLSLAIWDWSYGMFNKVCT